MLSTHYDYRLVTVSVFIAICGAYAALDLAERVAAANGEFRRLWIGGGACAMGTAIWSMHYIGMLAFQLPVDVHYDVPLVLLSMFAAILASLVALAFTSRTASGQKELAIGALAMGAGIVTMHYIGMAAMRMRCRCAYDWRIVCLSVVIAIVVSGVALARLRNRTNLAGTHKAAAAVLLGLAICSMHYTGMAAAHFSRSDRAVDFSGTATVSSLGGIGIGAGTLLLLGLAIISAMADKHFSAQSLRLHSTEERYRMLFERSVAGIYRTTLDGTVIDMNDACVQLLGYASREQVLGKIIRNVHFSEESKKTYVDMLREGKRLPSQELKMRQVDGSEMWVMASATVLEPQDGGPAEIQGMLLSIDELKRTEGELRSAKRAAESANVVKSQFLANMSHELRTPLNGVLGMAQILMLSPLSEDQKECLDAVRDSADSLLTVIDDILDFSTLATTPDPETTEEFSIRELFQVEMSAAGAIATAKRLSLRYGISDDVQQKFWGNPRWMRQIVSSLVGNAIKFTSAGEVEVTVRAEHTSSRDQLLEISVSDTGIGIPPEKHDSIFEPFNQLDNSNSRRFGGTGLGLATVRNLVEAMSGHISVESGENIGCTFTVLIPLPLQTPGAPTRLIGKRSTLAGQVETVLTV